MVNIDCFRKFATFRIVATRRVPICPEKNRQGLEARDYCNFMMHPDDLREAADVHLNLLAHHSRMQGILNTHAYALDSRAVNDFPPLFCFGDLVELELDCTSVENGRIPCKCVPAGLMKSSNHPYVSLEATTLLFNRISQTNLLQ